MTPLAALLVAGLCALPALPPVGAPAPDADLCRSIAEASGAELTEEAMTLDCPSPGVPLQVAQTACQWITTVDPRTGVMRQCSICNYGSGPIVVCF